MPINRKSTNSLMAVAKCVTAFEWEFCNVDQLSGMQMSISDHLHTGRKGVVSSQGIKLEGHVQEFL